MAKLRSKAARCDEVDLAPKHGLEPILHLEQMEVADRAVEFDEQVDIASRRRLVSSNRPEQGKAPDAEVAELPLVLADDV